MYKKWLIFVLVVGFLSACGDAAWLEPATTPALASPCMGGEWSLEFNRSGGFAGFDETLVLDSSGKLVVDSINPQASFQRSLPSEEIQRIAVRLEAACPFEPVSKSANCADCFMYTMTVHIDGEKYQLRATDVTLTEEQGALVGELQQYFNTP